MTEMGIIQILVYCLVLLLFVKPLGLYMARVYEGKVLKIDKVLVPIERMIYYLCRIKATQKMDWKHYLLAMLLFNCVGFLVVYAVLRLQFYFPINPQALPNITPDLAFNTAASFITNTNWQAYSGEITMSYFTQMIAFTVQNFLSAATGMSLLIALIRGIAKRKSYNLGNFWVDMVRSILYILLPLSLLLGAILVSQGVIQNFKANQKITLLQPLTYPETKIKNRTEQIIPMGPVASQEAIKLLGSNGGGFFNTNSAHPFENPTPLSNFIEMLALLLLPAAFCYLFGCMVNDKRQGWAILTAMFFILIPLMLVTVSAEQQGNPRFLNLPINQLPTAGLAPGGNMEGKEVRFGIINSALFATLTTATSNGSVNAMHDSFTPIGGMVLLFLMHLGEVVFGGVGSGLYGMLMVIIITVFVAGLMVGRTPEYLGKKIEPFEMKMAAFTIIIMPLSILLLTALASVTTLGVQAIGNPGAHGFSEILYAFTSMVSNNGSAFAGLNANSPFYNSLGGIAMLLSRYWIAIPTLAIAGSLARKKTIPLSLGTLPTNTPLFITLLISIIIILGALSFIPALALGPIVEHFMLWGPA